MQAAARTERGTGIEREHVSRHSQKTSNKIFFQIRARKRQGAATGTRETKRRRGPTADAATSVSRARSTPPSLHTRAPGAWARPSLGADACSKEANHTAPPLPSLRSQCAARSTRRPSMGWRPDPWCLRKLRTWPGRVRDWPISDPRNFSSPQPSPICTRGLTWTSPPPNTSPAPRPMRLRMPVLSPVRQRLRDAQVGRPLGALLLLVEARRDVVGVLLEDDDALQVRRE